MDRFDWRIQITPIHDLLYCDNHCHLLLFFTHSYFIYAFQQLAEHRAGATTAMDEEGDDDDDLCAICYAEPNTSVFKPCGVSSSREMLRNVILIEVIKKKNREKEQATCIMEIMERCVRRRIERKIDRASCRETQGE